MNDSTNPFLLPPQSVISFSGGRTSGLMLRRVLDAFGGTLPADRRVTFENTGKERDETLEFVEECSRRWMVPITWLEYRYDLPTESSKGRHYFVVVDFKSASRKGEPFEMAIQARKFLPNPIMRFCTAELKIRTLNRWVRQFLGWTTYHNAIGLRADEPKRVQRMRQRRTTTTTTTLYGEEKETTRASDLPPGESPLFPLHDAGATVEDVMTFWGEQPFDLRLRQDEGNCDLCFLKGAAKLTKILADRPELADWWIKAEAEAALFSKKASGATFRTDRPRYTELKLIATGEQTGPGWLWADDNNGSCGEIDECRCTD